MIQSIKPISIRQSKLSKQVPYRNGRIRFFILFLLSMVVFANMYAFNNPQALQDSLQKQLSITQTQFNMLYTIIALPNIIFPFFVGLIIDFLGIRIAFVSLTAAVAIFQTVVAFGAANGSFQTMLIGRMLFGIGVQSLSVAQVVFVSYWFLGKQLAFSIGVATTLPQLGNAINSLVTPHIYENTKNLGAPFFVSVGICCISFVCACIASYIDYKADQQDLQHNVVQLTESQSHISQNQPKGIQWKDFKQFQGTFWLIVLLCMFAIAQYIPFLDNVNKLLQVRFCFSQISAGKNIMVTYLVTSFLGFPLGIFADKIGYKRYFTIMGMTIFMFAHIIIFVYPQCDIYTPQPSWSGASWGLFLLGFAYCFYANCIIPSIPMVVSKKVTGTAFGIMLALQNFAMATCPIISGIIIQNSYQKQVGYQRASLFYLILGVFGVLLSCGLFFIGKQTKRILDGKSDEKKVYAMQLNPYYSQDQYKQRNKVFVGSSNNLQERLIKSYDHTSFSRQMQNIKPERKFQIQL